MSENAASVLFIRDLPRGPDFSHSDLISYIILIMEDFTGSMWEQSKILTHFMPVVHIKMVKKLRYSTIRNVK